MWRRSRQIDANSSANGIVNATISAPRMIAKEQKENHNDQDDALGQVVQHRVRGQLQQIAAIQERDDRSRPGGSTCSFSSFDLGVDALER